MEKTQEDSLQANQEAHQISLSQKLHMWRSQLTMLSVNLTPVYTRDGCTASSWVEKDHYNTTFQ